MSTRDDKLSGMEEAAAAKAKEDMVIYTSLMKHYRAKIRIADGSVVLFLR